MLLHTLTTWCRTEEWARVMVLLESKRPGSLFLSSGAHMPNTLHSFESESNYLTHRYTHTQTLSLGCEPAALWSQTLFLNHQTTAASGKGDLSKWSMATRSVIRATVNQSGRSHLLAPGLWVWHLPLPYRSQPTRISFHLITS